MSIARKYITLRMGGGATPWYLSGGVAQSSLIAAWSPAGAASLAASYLRVAGSGGNANLDPAVVGGTAPAWDTVNGWKGDGLGAYLKTGIVITDDQTHSAIVKFSNNPAVTTSAIFGFFRTTGGTSAFMIRAYTARNYWSGNKQYSVGGALASGTLAIAGRNAYYNGTAEAAQIDAGTGTNPLEMYILALNNNGTAATFTGAYIQKIAFYNTILTAAQVLAITTHP